MKSFEAIARAAYETFCTTAPQGGIPWGQLPKAAQEAWMAASRKMAEEIQQVH